MRVPASSKIFSAYIGGGLLFVSWVGLPVPVRLSYRECTSGRIECNRKYQRHDIKSEQADVTMLQWDKTASLMMARWHARTHSASSSICHNQLTTDHTDHDPPPHQTPLGDTWGQTEYRTLEMHDITKSPFHTTTGTYIVTPIPRLQYFVTPWYRNNFPKVWRVTTLRITLRSTSWSSFQQCRQQAHAWFYAVKLILPIDVFQSLQTQVVVILAQQHMETCWFIGREQWPTDHEVLLFRVLQSGTRCHRLYVHRPLHSDSFRVH